MATGGTGHNLQVGKRYRLTFVGTVTNSVSRGDGSHDTRFQPDKGVHFWFCDTALTASELVDPPGWPVQQGDVWGDENGERWFAVASTYEPGLIMVSWKFTGRVAPSPEELREQHPSLVLLSRDSW